jgi:hypothetical protein
MKSFNEQMSECKKNGNLIFIDADEYYTEYYTLPRKLLVCLKNKCVCYSGACIEERLINDK